MALYDGPVPPFLAGEYRVALVSQTWERVGHHRLRRQVFCDEQGIFEVDDRDELDAVATHIVAIACMFGEADRVVGAVRIHEAEPAVWWGSRLAVERDHRRVSRIGAELISLAVRTAAARGCRTFLAHVQSQNAPMFERLHWTSLRETELHGRAHHLMRADLAYYPPHGREATQIVRPLEYRVAALPDVRAA